MLHSSIVKMSYNVILNTDKGFDMERVCLTGCQELEQYLCLNTQKFRFVCGTFLTTLHKTEFSSQRTSSLLTTNC